MRLHEVWKIAEDCMREGGSAVIWIEDDDRIRSEIHLEWTTQYTTDPHETGLMYAPDGWFERTFQRWEALSDEWRVRTTPGPAGPQPWRAT